MRRLRLKASSVVPGSIGWNSPKPAATRRCGGTPLLIRYCTTEMARAADSSQFDLNGEVAGQRPRIGMAVDAQHPIDLRRNLLFQIEQRAGELVEFGAAFRPQHRGAAVEEHLRLEHEAVADDADIGTVAENFAQLAEEVRAIARQFLHALRQRDVEALAEIGDVDLRILLLVLGGAERVFERGDLAAQRADLLIEDFDLRHRARGRFLLDVELRGELADLGLAGVGAWRGARRPRRAAGRARLRPRTARRAAARPRSSRLVLPVCSSDSSSDSREICALSRASAVSLPATSCDRKNCATMNTVSRKMIDRISVDSASTKPGQ